MRTIERRVYCRAATAPEGGYRRSPMRERVCEGVHWFIEWRYSEWLYKTRL